MGGGTWPPPRFPITDVWSPLGRPWHTPKGWGLKVFVTLCGSIYVISKMAIYGLEIERRAPAPTERTWVFELHKHAEDDDPSYIRDPESLTAQFWKNKQPCQTTQSPWDQMFQAPAHVDTIYQKASP